MRTAKDWISGIRWGGTTALSRPGTSEIVTYQVRVFHAEDPGFRVGSVQAEAASEEEATARAVSLLAIRWATVKS